MKKKIMKKFKPLNSFCRNLHYFSTLIFGTPLYAKNRRGKIVHCDKAAALDRYKNRLSWFGSEYLCELAAMLVEVT